ncbi:uncharacterized protein artn [Stigmatopora argus]
MFWFSFSCFLQKFGNISEYTSYYINTYSIVLSVLFLSFLRMRVRTCQPCHRSAHAHAHTHTPTTTFLPRVSSDRPVHVLRKVQVMLWLVTTLLALSEDVLSEEARPQNRLEPPRRAVGRTPRRTPARGSPDRADALWTDGSEAWTHTDGAPKRWRWRRSLQPTSKRVEGGAGCRLERRRLHVRDLDMGYDSDETVVFKFCAGSCRAARRNYDLALGVLVARGHVSPRRVHRRPCCRPTRYEAVSFMDVRATWRTVRRLSAGDCGCLG